MPSTQPLPSRFDEGLKEQRAAFRLYPQAIPDAFAIEKRAAEYFPRMFTHDHFDIIATPERLSQTMCRRFARLHTA